MKKQFFILALSLSVIAVVSSCKKDPKTDENELITDVTLQLFSPTDTTYASFSDPDGTGGTAPRIDTLFLKPANTYTMNVLVLNKSTSPITDVSDEIKEEDVDHQFFYTITGVNASYMYTDSDANSKPVGLSGRLTTTSLSTGSIQVVLKHQPGIKDGNSATGSTDIDILFPAQIR